jgi:N-acetylneuraminic acid mutarotase
MTKACPPLVALLLLATAVAASAQSPGFWEPRPSLSLARQEVAAAALDGVLYVSGGLDTNGTGVAVVERFDPATGLWSSVAPLPVPRHHHGMAAAAGALFSIGGFQQSFIGDARCFRFAPGAGHWTEVASLPRGRGALVAAEIGGLIYAVGGVVPGVGVVGDLTVYDPAQNQWNTLPSMPTPREHLAAAALGGQLYVAGGRSGGQLFDVLERYDPVSRQWQTLAPMPTARGGTGAATLDGKLIVVGGEGSALPGGVFPQAEEYDPIAGTWRSLAPMPQALHGIYPVTLGSEIVVAGGATVAGFGASNVVWALRHLPTGTVRYGVSTPACFGPIAIDVGAVPQAGNPSFHLRSSRGPIQSTGALFLATTPDPVGLVIAGIRLHLGLAPLFSLPAFSDAQGAAATALPLVPGTAGARFDVQYVWFDTGGCAPGPLSASDALDITIR